ncbi:MAG: hypothetical protein KDJ65_04325 [Anaerolineae bacterium]|nr:hypothetical protein [Anaerolineae bacterium]
MKRLIFPMLWFLSLYLTACGGAAVAPVPEPTLTEIAVSTLPPPTATDTAVPSSSTATSSTATPDLAEAAPTEAIASEPTALPTDTPTLEPTATPTPEPDWLNNAGRTAENLMYLGNPNASVTLVDFSDFM